MSDVLAKLKAMRGGDRHDRPKYLGDGIHESVKLDDIIAELEARAGEAVPQGWKLVPIEPSNKMTAVGQEHRYESVWSIGAIYREMIAHAPIPPTGDAAGTFVRLQDLESIYEAMNHLGDTLNEMDAVEKEDEVATDPGFSAIRDAIKRAGGKP
jgi:hypothetical protein